MKTSVAALLLAACNPNDAGPGRPKASFYAGPGSVWTAQVNPDSTSTLLHFPMLGDRTADQLINASDAVGSDGITTLTVTSSAGVDAAAEGATASAVELPGVLYTVAFADTTRPIVMVPAQVCPGAALSATFIKLRGSASDVAGTFTYDPQNGIAAEATRYDVTGAPFGSLLALGAGPCALGVATLDSTDELFLSDSGTALVHTMPALEPTGDEVELALAVPDAAVTPASFAGSYAGTLFDGATDRGVTATIGAGTGTISAADGTQVGSLALTSSGAQNGLALGTMTLGSAQPAVCAIGSSTPPLVACATQTESGALVSLVLAPEGTPSTQSTH